MTVSIIFINLEVSLINSLILYLTFLVKEEEVSPDSSQFSNGSATIKIKLEPDLEPIKSEEFYQMDQLFKADPSELMLFQMPDTLPGRMPDDNERDSKIKSETNEEATSSLDNKSKGPKLCSLDHLEEGLIGKLVRHRSGKTKLLIGESIFDIEMGLTCDFQQNAVVIESNTQQRSASMYSLGEIHTKYKVTPDWNWLFENMKDP